MSRWDEPVTPAAVRLAADLTVDQHMPGGNVWKPGTCWQCRADGCPQLRWALDSIAGMHPAYPVPERRSSAEVASAVADTTRPARGVVAREQVTAR